MSQSTSRTAEAGDFLEAMEYAWDQGWTDGLPVVPPFPELVSRFLDHAGLEPDEVIGTYEVRNRVVTADKLAMNAVMAGCKPAYLPVVRAAIEAVTDPAFHLNHIASTSSPWPLFIVNGPIAEELGINHRMYVLGPGCRANATIGRAISLTLANCMDARVGGVQQGNLGNPSRMGGQLIAEDEETGWEPLSTLLGAERGTNTVTAVGTMGFPQQIFRPLAGGAEAFAAVLAAHLAEGSFQRGTHVVLLSPTFQRPFLHEGWSKEDLRQYLLQNTRASVAQLKRRGRYPRPDLPYMRGLLPIEEGDEERMVVLASDERFDPPNWEPGTGPQADFLIANAGGDAGVFAALYRPFPLEDGRVVKEIRSSTSG